MIVKQHLVFILYSLCASVFKGEGRWMELEPGDGRGVRVGWGGVAWGGGEKRWWLR